jgi:hypothetical protein
LVETTVVKCALRVAEKGTKKRAGRLGQLDDPPAGLGGKEEFQLAALYAKKRGKDS